MDDGVTPPRLFRRVFHSRPVEVEALLEFPFLERLIELLIPERRLADMGSKLARVQIHRKVE